MKVLLAMDTFPFVIKQIKDSRDGSLIYNRPLKNESLENPGVVLLQDVPGYLRIDMELPANSPSFRTFSTQKTYVVNLEKYSNGNEYIKQHFGPKSRSALKRYKNRLESCFSVHYKVYTGAIDKAHYDILFENLKELMVHRFQEKNERNYELSHLEEIKEDVYPKLLQEQANLFVIYANGKPISIRINMMKGTLAFYILSAFDPDFEVFRLGKLDMWQNIDWLIKQGYSKYDLLKGYGYIKERWADDIYSNDLVLINNDHSLWGNLRFHLLSAKTNFRKKLITTIKYLKLDKKIRAFKKRKKRDYKKNKFEPIPIDDLDKAKKMFGKKITEVAKIPYLKKSIIQLAYKHQFPVGQIQVFKSKDNGHYILIKNRCYILRIT